MLLNTRVIFRTGPGNGVLAMRQASESTQWIAASLLIYMAFFVFKNSKGGNGSRFRGMSRRSKRKGHEAASTRHERRGRL